MGLEQILDSELKKDAFSGETLVSWCFLLNVGCYLLFSYITYNQIVSEFPNKNWADVLPFMTNGLNLAGILLIFLFIWASLNFVKECCNYLDRRDDKKEYFKLSYGDEL